MLPNVLSPLFHGPKKKRMEDLLCKPAMCKIYFKKSIYQNSFIISQINVSTSAKLPILLRIWVEYWCHSLANVKHIIMSHLHGSEYIVMQNYLYSKSIQRTWRRGYFWEISSPYLSYNHERCHRYNFWNICCWLYHWIYCLDNLRTFSGKCTSYVHLTVLLQLFDL